jgi:PAS domain S-box-containing protein
VKKALGAIDLTQATMPALTGLATWCVTATGRVLLWSPAAAELFGKADDEVRGHDMCDVLLDGEHRDVFTVAENAGPSSALLPVRLGDGAVVPVEFRCEPMTGDDGQTMMAISALPRRDGPETDRALLRIGATLDLRQTARDLVDAFVARLCFSAGVYVLERLLVDDQMPSMDEGEDRIVVRRMALTADDDARHEWASAFPADEVIACHTDTAFARCMSTGRPIMFTDLDTQTRGRLEDRVSARPRINEILSYDSFLAVPLIARGSVLGFTVLARRPGDPLFTQADAAHALMLADHAAVCMDNGRLYDRERRTSMTLQRSLLPVTLKTPPGMEIAHRYLPAGQTSRIGGDWYDAIPLAGSKVALVVGDAMGHGTTAALVMGQLRTAVRILARLGLPPADLLHHLDEIAQELTTAQFATCVYAVCDPAGGLLTIARAGHVPPVLAADGTSEVLDLPPGLPLGVGEARYEATQVRVPENSTLVLCTDGLIESRTREMDEGMAELRSILPGAPPGLDAMCEAIVKHLHGGTGGDDATLLLARIQPRAGRRGR